MSKKTDPGMGKKSDPGMGKKTGKPCVVKGCRNTHAGNKDAPKKITFHRFPMSDPERVQSWVDAIGREEDYVPSAYARVCSAHFPEEDFDRTGQVVRLHKHALPVLGVHGRKVQNTRSKQRKQSSPIRIMYKRGCKRPGALYDDDSEAESEEEPITKKTKTGRSLSPNKMSSRRHEPAGPGPSHTSGEKSLASYKMAYGKRNQEPAQVLYCVAGSEHNYAICESPKRLKQKMNRIDDGLQNIKKKFKHEQQKTRILRARVEKLEKTIASLGKQRNARAAVDRIIDSTLDDIPKEIFQRLIGIHDRYEYSDEMKEFAVTLHTHSPDAYEYVREFFMDALPHTTTLRGWCKVQRKPSVESESLQGEEDRVLQDTIMLDGAILEKLLTGNNLMQT